MTGISILSPLESCPNTRPSIYYLPSFITLSEESVLLDAINSQPLPTWRQLSHRRLQAHPSVLSASNVLLDQPLPEWLLEPVIRKLGELLVSSPENEKEQRIFEHSPHGAPNHVLINEYEPGQGILPHEDGKAYFPVVCTVSLGSHTVYNIYPKTTSGMIDSKSRWRLLQEPRSLLITMGEAYEECLHGIDGVEVDVGLTDREGLANWELLREETRKEIARAGGSLKRGARVSLTCRDVVRVKKLKGFGFLAK